jgi:hypothetical protein
MQAVLTSRIELCDVLIRMISFRLEKRLNGGSVMSRRSVMARRNRGGPEAQSATSLETKKLALRPGKHEAKGVDATRQVSPAVGG